MPDLTRGASRRNFFGTAAAISVAGILPLARQVADGPLFEACSEYHRLHAKAAACDAACRAACEEDAELDAAWSDACDRADDAVEGLLPIVPMTAAGLAAKAAVVRSALRLAPEMEWRDRVADALIRDAQAFAEGVA